MPFATQVRRVVPFLFIVIALVVVYDAWVFYSRWDRTRQAERQREEREAAEARRTLALIGELKILNFYAAPPIIERGQHARLCYSVVSAKNVRMEPPIQKLYPALSHCLEVSPQKDTGYRLFADDGAGHSVTAQTVLKVVR